MNYIENPTQFLEEKLIGKYKIEYSQLMEICQGGPEVGGLLINNNQVKGRYGGPFIIKENDIYIPAYFNSLFKSGFKIARINLISLKVEYLSKIKPLIFLEKVVENRIYYFEDINKKKIFYNIF